MINENIYYTSSRGDVAHLNGEDRYSGFVMKSICNIRESRAFRYGIVEKTATVEDKNFEVEVVVLGEQIDTWVEVFLEDVQSNKYGILSINMWELPCFVVGISNISYEEKNSAYKFSLGFYAPKFLWAYPTYYKYQNSKFYQAEYNERTDTWSWMSSGTNTLRESNGQYGLSLLHDTFIYPSADFTGKINGNFEFTLNLENSMGYTIATNKYKINLTEASFIEASYYKRTINKYNTQTYEDENAISLVPDDSNWFYTTPYVNAISGSVTGGTLASGYIVFVTHRLRGLPAWEW